MREYKLVYLGLILLVGLIAYAGLGGLSIELQAASSASPFNPGIYGTSELMQLIGSLGYKVKTGSPKDLEKLSSDNIVYVLIAPDKPLSREEVSILYSLASEKRLNLLVADELGVVNELVEKLLNTSIAGSQLRDENYMRTGLKDFAEAYCGIGGFEGKILLSKPSAITAYSDTLKPFCMAVGKLWLDIDADENRGVDEPLEKELPVGVYGSYIGGRAVVLADSTVLVNFMLNGFRGLNPTKPFVIAMVKWVSKGDKNTLFFFDTTHYKSSKYSLASALRILLSLPAYTVKAVEIIASAAGRVKYIMFSAVFAALLAAFTKPEPVLIEKTSKTWRMRLARELAEDVRRYRRLDKKKIRKLVENAKASEDAAEKLAEYLIRSRRG